MWPAMFSENRADNTRMLSRSSRRPDICSSKPSKVVRWVSPVLLPVWQCPFMQAEPAEQTFPQKPQLFASDWKLTPDSEGGVPFAAVVPLQVVQLN